MKKVFGILTALLPAIYAGSIGLCFYLSPEDEVLLAFLGGFILLSLVFCIGYGTASHKADSLCLSRMNLWIIGGNLLLFAAEITWLIIATIQVHIATQQGGMEGGLGIFLLIILYMPSWISYLICRFTAVVCCFDALKEKADSGIRTLHTLFHLFPVLDLISAIWVYGRVKRCQVFQQPTIETE